MSSDETEGTWIQNFVYGCGNEFFAQVDESFLADQFNLTGLSEIVPDFRRTWKKILDHDDSSEKQSNRYPSADLTKNCELLYGVVHARYILSANGLQKMYEKVAKREFGKCPRVLCDGSPLIPTGIHDEPGMSTVKLFCACCNDIYSPSPNKRRPLDGAYFGTSFAEMLIMAHPYLRDEPKKEFVPRLYGFKIHPKAYK